MPFRCVLCCMALLIAHSVNSLEVCLCSYKANRRLDSTVQSFSLSFVMIPIQSAAQTHRKFDIIIIIFVSFVQGIHTHIPETNHVPRGYIVAAVLSLLFMVPLYLVPVLALSFFHVNTFRSMCAVPNMAVFCSSLTS